MTHLDCRVCQHADGNVTLAAREMMFGMRDAFQYIVCAGCGCVQIAQIPDNLSRYYPPDYYSFAPPRRDGWIRAFRLRCHAAHVMGRPNPIGWLRARRHGIPPPLMYLRTSGMSRRHSVLDVGSGTGALLLEMRSYGCTQLTGLDPFIERDIDYGNGVRILRRELDDYPGRHDLVMLHHTFEHMDAPLHVLERIRDLLNPGGVLLVRIPLASSEAFETYGADWVQLDPPRHLYLHTRRSIELLARQAGLEIVQVVYDSTGFGFWGSEQYRRDIPLLDRRSYHVDPANSIFTPLEIRAFEARARRLNDEGRGDQACFYLRVRA